MVELSRFLWRLRLADTEVVRTRAADHNRVGIIKDWPSPPYNAGPGHPVIITMKTSCGLCFLQLAQHRVGFRWEDLGMSDERMLGFSSSTLVDAPYFQHISGRFSCV